MEIKLKQCKTCKEEKPITLFSGEQCHSCKHSLLEEVDRESSKSQMTQDQIARQQKLSDEVFAEQLNKAKQKENREKEEFNRTQAARKELAQRALARKRLLPFVKRFNPDYMPGWVHVDISVRLEKFSEAVTNKESPRLMLFLPPRHGKQIAHNTPILTANRGWTTHGNLLEGDEVFSPNGNPIEVLALSEESASDHVVTFTNGEQIRCHANHEWTFWDRGNKKWRTEETRWFLQNTNRGTPRKLTSGDIGKRGGRYMYQLPDVDLSFDPYTLSGKKPKLYITDVACIPNGEKGRCIQVDSNDGLYLVGKTLIPTHNSELASKTFPAWHLGQNPRHEIIASSYAADLAMDFSRKVRGIIADPDYGKVFPQTSLDKKSQSAERWNTSVGGGYVAAGVGGAITGRGAHIGIIDDPIKNREDAESASGRQKIKDWYTSTFYTRLAPGGGILVILTRWHDDDLAGWLIEQEKTGGDKWEIVKYPAISTSDEFYRREGEPLHADRYPLESLERIKRAVGERDWSALYQQNPVPDTGAYFQKDWFRYYDKEPARDTMKIYQAWDFAIGQAEHNDYTVGVTIGVGQDDKVYVLHVSRGKWDALEIIDKIIDEYVAYGAQIVGVERGQIEMALGPMLRKRMRERNVIFPTEMLKTGRRDKQARARPLQARMQQGMVLFPKHADFTIEIKNEMLRFPAGTHDDQVDALAWCFQMLDMFTVVRAPKPKKPASWRDKLSAHLGKGSSKSHMRA
jgi:predicted phage terminase large subunit-like protein